MKHVLLRFSAVGVAAVFLVLLGTAAGAQAPAEPAPTKSPSPEELTQAELLKAYLQMREQLLATQLAIVNKRVEAEAAGRAQAAAVAEKVDAIKLAIEKERERVQAEREREHAELQRTIRIVLWVGAGLAGAGLLAMLVMPLFQLRAMNRMAELAVHRPALAVAGPTALLASDAPLPSDQAVNSSSHRLMSVIDRVEKRIGELEQTATSPLPTNSAPAKPSAPSLEPISIPSQSNGKPGDPKAAADGKAVAEAKPEQEARRVAVANDQAPWIAVLMNKARSLVGSSKPLEAVACYDEILKLDAKHTEALVRKGAALERLNRFEEAIVCYERAIELDPKMTLAHLHKAAACNRVGRYEQAVECFEQALHVEEKRAKPAAATA